MLGEQFGEQLDRSRRVVNDLPHLDVRGNLFIDGAENGQGQIGPVLLAGTNNFRLSPEFLGSLF